MKKTPQKTRHRSEQDRRPREMGHKKAARGPEKTENDGQRPKVKAQVGGHIGVNVLVTK